VTGGAAAFESNTLAGIANVARGIATAEYHFVIAVWSVKEAESVV
jgi:hypothetical protein